VGVLSITKRRNSARVEQPVKYLWIVATLMPRELRVDSNMLDGLLSQMTDEELTAAIICEAKLLARSPV
jgi:hypothetical protein